MAAPPHLCLVSNQPMPSLTPLLDPQFGIRDVTLLAAPDRLQHAHRLKAALARHNIKAAVIRLRDGYDLAKLRQDLSAIAKRFPDGVTLNVTGGTKLMGIAAWEVFNRESDRLYYVHIGHDRIDWLRPQGLQSQAIADRIRLETYFASLGLKLRKGAQPDREPLPNQRYATLASQARKLAATTARSHTGSDEGGYWLEELVFEELRRLSGCDPLIHDVARQFVLTNDAEHASRLDNEIDVAVLRDNTLYLVECKTGVSGQGAGAMKSLFKLAQLRTLLGGLRGRGIFVSSEFASSVLHERGRQLGISVIDRSHLSDLPRHLQEALCQT